MSGEPFLAMAVRLTAAGRRVFPVEAVRDPDGNVAKKPAITGYHGTTPYCLSQLRRMPWHRATWVGMALYPGEVGVDVDVKNGKAGYMHLRQLEDAYGQLPSTLMQPTPSGGEHRVFRWEQADRLPGRFVLPGGGWADIDVIHARNRYLVVYRPEQILSGLDYMNALPAAWRPALGPQRATRVRPGTNDRSSGIVRAAIEQVRAARTYRNVTLNEEVFAAVLSGFCSTDDIEAFREASMNSGLAAVVVDATVSSAMQAAARCWQEPAFWYRSLLAGVDSWSPRRRVLVEDSAAHLARTAVHCGKSEVDMACRELADAMGVSAPTAAQVLRDLTSRGWLVGTDGSAPGTARRYLLAHPAAANSYKHPAPADTAVPAQYATGAFLPVFSTVAQTRLALRGLSAFQALGSGPVLSQAALAVAAEVSVGPASLQTLRARTRLNATTIARAVQALESTGVFRMSEDGVVTLDVPDLEAGLDSWSRAMGLPDRPRLRREQFAAQREAHGAYLDQLEAAAAYALFDPFLELIPLPESASEFSSWLFVPSANVERT